MLLIEKHSIISFSRIDNGKMGNGIVGNGVMGNGVIRAGESKSMDRNDLLCQNDSPVQTSQISGSQKGYHQSRNEKLINPPDRLRV